MKKTIIILGLILALSVGSAIAFAETNSEPSFGRGFNRMQWNNSNLTDEEIEDLKEERLEIFEEYTEDRKADLKADYEKGDITEEQYNTWLEHFNYTEEFHKENGFYGGFGGCGGRGTGRGYGGMMGRFN